MLIAVQFPFADTRAFVSSQTNRLHFPTWPVPEPDREFVRTSGIVRHRRRGGLDSWPGEEVYCDARRALRFQPLLRRQPVGHLGTSVCLICVFRRFLFDGEVVSRVEVGFEMQACEPDAFHRLDGHGCLDLIDACLSLPVRVPSAEGSFVSCELVSCAQYLAKHYLLSTTRRIAGNLAMTQDWWLTSGKPLLLIEYAPHEIRALPKLARSVEPHSALWDSLHYCPIERAGKRVGVWFIRLDLHDLDLVRRTRLHLFRLHAERECLRQVFRLIILKKLQPGVHTASSDRLQRYLRDSMRLLSRETRYGLSECKIFDEALKVEDLVSPGERATLLAQLTMINTRRNVYHRLEEFTVAGADSVQDFHIIGNNTIVNVGRDQRIGGTDMSNYEIRFGDNAKFIGDFVVANTIQDSFNKISKSDASQELKEKLKELSEAVAEMCDRLPQDKARVAARDLDILTSEALSDKPRRKWCDMSAKNLIKVAQVVGQVAVPVITIVKSLLLLLG